MKRITETDKKDNKLDTSSNDGIKYKPLCQEDISQINTLNAAHSRTFRSFDLIPKDKTNLQIRCYTDYYGGYAEHARYVIFGLDEIGKYNIKVTNIKTPIDIDPITYNKVNWFINNPVDLSNSLFMAIAGPGWFQKKFLPEKRKVIAWTMIESRKYSNECASWINNADYILCPTKVDAVRAIDSGIPEEKLVIARLGYDETLYNENIKSIEFSNINKNTFVFGVLGSWNHRKGVEEIIRAYCSKFTSSDNVCLLMVSKYGNRKYGEHKDNDECWTIQYEFNQVMDDVIKSTGRDKKSLPQISLIDLPVHSNVLPAIMARFNCLVGFSKGESTWLPGLQAMAMNIPVIQLASECSGFMDYLNSKNSLLCTEVKYKIADESLYEGTSEYYKDQEFAFGNYDELADNMEKMLHMSEFSKSMLLANAKKESLDWTWKKSISNLDSIIQMVR